MDFVLTDFSKDTLISFAENKLFPALIIFAIGCVIIRMVIHFLEKALERSSRVDNMLIRFITGAVRIALYLLIAMDVLSTVGISTKFIAGVLAGATAAFALGLQNNLANLTSGVLIIISRIFVQGEWICCDGYEGRVKSIDLMNTTIITRDNETITIPNSNISSSTVDNYSRSGKRRLDITIGVSYSSDITLVRRTLVDVMENCKYTLKKEPMRADVESYDDSAITLLMLCWVKPNDYWEAKYEIQNNIKPFLDRAQISIPFPQLDLHQID